jgi:hypothetical protein
MGSTPFLPEKNYLFFESFFINEFLTSLRFLDTFFESPNIKNIRIKKINI